MQCNLLNTINDFLKPYYNYRWVVAFSGGIDSTVLLHCVVYIAKKLSKIDLLTAIHIDHNINPKSKDWSNHCQSICDHYGIQLIINKCEAYTNQSSLETEARQLRYDFFTAQLKDNDCLIMAHHQDDQAETCLFRLFRGCGLDGLKGIPQKRPLGKGLIIRPMLDVTRLQIENYANQHQLSYIEDDSNDNTIFDRNYIRHQILPKIKARWPQSNQNIAQLAAQAQAQEAQNNNWCQQFIQQETHPPHWFLTAKQLKLPIDTLKAMNSYEQTLLLRYWIITQGLLPPSYQQIQQIQQQLIYSQPDSNPLIMLQEGTFRKFNHYLVLTKTINYISPWPNNHALLWDIQHTPYYDCPLLGKLAIINNITDGVTHSNETPYYSKVSLQPSKITIINRSHFDPQKKITIPNRLGSKTLKRWLQELAIPPWIRNRLPILLCGETSQLIGIPGVLINHQYQPKNNDDHIITIYWAPNFKNLQGHS